MICVFVFFCMLFALGETVLLSSHGHWLCFRGSSLCSQSTLYLVLSPFPPLATLYSSCIVLECAVFFYQPWFYSCHTLQERAQTLPSFLYFINLYKLLSFPYPHKYVIARLYLIIVTLNKNVSFPYLTQNPWPYSFSVSIVAPSIGSCTDFTFSRCSRYAGFIW